MPLIFDDDVVPVDVGGGETIWIKRAFNSGDFAAMQRASTGAAKMHMTAGAARAAADAKLARAAGETVPEMPDDMEVATMNIGDMFEAAEFAALDIAVKRWTFKYPATTIGPDGETLAHPQALQPVPVEPKFIRMLDEATTKFLKDAINELNKGVDGDTKVASSTAQQPPISTLAPLHSPVS